MLDGYKLKAKAKYLGIVCKVRGLGIPVWLVEYNVRVDPVTST